jgi:hypothetical protein
LTFNVIILYVKIRGDYMEQDSLREARKLLVNVIVNSEITQEDKIEILMNLYKFLNDMQYNNDIKTFEKELELRKQYDSSNKRRK